VERVFAGPHGEAIAALQPIDYQVHENDFVTILGPSGCGKSTLLRIIAGLDTPTRGEVWLDGALVDGPGADRGMVFQSYTLFPWLTVRENICFGLQERGISKAQQRERSDYYLHQVGLHGFEHHYPRQLSGGMQQRTAIARALANDPKVLLMDEPFGALDAKVRKELRRWLSRLHEDINLTSVFVTHDQEEAMEVADRIVLMNKGVIEQIGTPDEVYNRPATEFVYNFLGDSNRLKLAGHDQTIQFRPHEVTLSKQTQADFQPVVVKDIRPLGALTRLVLKVDGNNELIEAEVAHDDEVLTGLHRGDVVQFKPKRYNHDWEI